MTYSNSYRLGICWGLPMFEHANVWMPCQCSNIGSLCLNGRCQRICTILRSHLIVLLDGAYCHTSVMRANWSRAQKREHQSSKMIIPNDEYGDSAWCKWDEISALLFWRSNQEPMRVDESNCRTSLIRDHFKRRHKNLTQICHPPSTLSVMTR